MNLLHRLLSQSTVIFGARLFGAGLTFVVQVAIARFIGAQALGDYILVMAAVNIIADPSWDESRYEVIRQWALSVLAIVHLTVNTPYPGTETWQTESRKLQTRDYRLFDVQHAVLPTTLPLEKFYGELVKTQQVLNMKHLGWNALKGTFKIAAKHLMNGQTNFVKMLWKFSNVYSVERQVRDHQQHVKYQISLPQHQGEKLINPSTLYIHHPEAVHTASSVPREASATT